MKYIHIFIASSIIELEEERLKLRAFLNSVNNIFVRRDIYFDLSGDCEDESAYVRFNGMQPVYNKNASDSDYFFAMFGKKAGEYTTKEFEEAFKHFLETETPKIYTYFKKLPDNVNAEESLLNMKHRLGDELGHYYKVFTHIDTIKLEILLEFCRDSSIGGTIDIFEGEAYLDEEPVLSLSNIPVFSRNKHLKKLIDQKKENDSMFEYLATLSANPMREKLKRENIEERRKLTKQLYKVEMDILSLVRSISAKRYEGKLKDPREIKAMEYIDAGDYEAAKEMLSDPLWEMDLQEAMKLSCLSKERISEYISGKRLYIQTLQAEGITKEKEQKVIDIFETLSAIVRDNHMDLDVLYDYAVFLQNHNRHEEAIPILQRNIRELELDGDPSTELADSEYMLACILYKINRIPESIDLHKKALKIREKFSRAGTFEDKRKLGSSCYQLGYLYSRTGESRLAETLYDRAQLLYKELLEQRPKDRDTLKDYALTLNNLAMLYQQDESFEEAKAHHLQAMQIRKQLAASKKVPDLGFLAMSYLNYARFIEKTDSDSQEAEQYFNKAISLYRELSEKDTKYYRDTAIAQFYYAEALAKKDKEAALHVHREALKTREELFGEGRGALESDLSDSCFAVGRLMIDLGMKEGRTFIEKSIAIRKRLAKLSEKKYGAALREVREYLDGLQ